MGTVGRGQAREARERDWFTKRTVGERVTKAIGVEKFNCAYFRSDVSQIPRPFPLVHPPTPPWRLRLSPPYSFAPPRSSQPLSFVLHLSFSRRKTRGICGLLFFPFSFSPSPVIHPPLDSCVYTAGRQIYPVINVEIRRRLSAAAAIRFRDISRRIKLSRVKEFVASSPLFSTLDDLVSTFSLSLFETHGQRPWIRDTPYANAYDARKPVPLVCFLSPPLLRRFFLHRAHPRILLIPFLFQREKRTLPPYSPPPPPPARRSRLRAPHLYFYCHNQFN